MLFEHRRSRIFPELFEAGNIVQLLAAAACFLAAYVIPLTFPGHDSLSRTIFLTLGCVFFVSVILRMVFRRSLTAMTARLGIRSSMQLPREGLVYLGIMLIVAVSALTGGNPDTGNMLLLVFGMMAGPFVLNGWVVVAMLSRIHVQRKHPSVAPAGEFFSVSVLVRNDKRFLSSRLLEIHDVVQGGRLREFSAVTFVRIGPKQERVGDYQVCITRRGLYRLGPIRISSRFPLGIGERGQTISGVSEIIVYPPIGHLLPGWARRERELAESVRRANARIGIFNDEFHGIREYRAGDNSRAIHWRSTARQGRMMVKEHQQHREADLIVLLDLYAAPEFTEALQERAVSLAATLCVEQTRQTSSGSYRLAIAGKELVSLEIAGAGRFREAALRALAVCEAAPKAPLASMLIAACQGPVSSASRFVLITPRPDAAELLLEAISRDAAKNERQLFSRLMIIHCTDEHLADVFAEAEPFSSLVEGAVADA